MIDRLPPQSLEAEQSVLGAILIDRDAVIEVAEFLPGSWSIFRGMSHEKATGLAAFTGGLAESVFSPLFWALAVLFFVLFFAASRLEHKILRVFLFWIPTLMVSAFGLAIVALFTYVFIESRHRFSGQ